MNLLEDCEVYIHGLWHPSNQPESGELEYEVFSQIDRIVIAVASYFVEGAVASTTDEVKFAAFVETSNLKTAWYIASTRWVHRVSAPFIQKSDEFVTRRTLQVRAISIAVPIACSCGKSLEVLSTFMAQRTSRFWWIRRKNWLRSRFVLDPSHFLRQRGRVVVVKLRDVF